MRQVGLERMSSPNSRSRSSIADLSHWICSSNWDLRTCEVVRRLLSSEVSISTSCRRRTTIARSSRDFSSGRGRAGGRTALANRARTRASIASVLASLPTARAKSRTWRGLTIDVGNAAISSSAASGISSAPVASKTIPDGLSATSHSTSRPIPSVSFLNRSTSPPGSTAVSRYAAETSIPTKASECCDCVMVTLTSFGSECFYLRPALQIRAHVWLQSTVRACRSQGVTILLGDGLIWAKGESICHASLPRYKGEG